ncbi:MAG: phosphate signaling complex protein PhoU [Planctomycetes bacterium]|nr:phosphate signaling complex protein PhoU [Planctomycetota bacterium]
MLSILQNELEKLKKRLLALSAVVEENLQLAIRAVENRDAALAEEVCERDSKVDGMEVEVEEECLKILALHQPVAVDLRFIVAVLKMNNDLERIGDQAVNIAHKVQHLCNSEEVSINFNFQAMFKRVQKMLHNALDSLINLDSELARTVCAMDDEVDQMKHEMPEEIFALIKDNSENVKSLFALNGVVRNLERIGDLASNIAEDVIYMVEGNIIRHGGEFF